MTYLGVLQKNPAYINEMSDNRRFYELMAQRQAGNLTLQDRVELKKILESDTELAAIYGYISEIFDADFNECTEMDEVLIEEKWSSLQNKISPLYKKSTHSYKNIIYWAVAASVLLAALFTYFYFSNPESLINKDNIVSTRKGSKSKLVLPDGTQVWLNADSKISYNDHFGASTREISLSGEAYFEVVKDKTRPFIVHTPAMDIKVMGTVFNVKAYPADEASQTSLIEGSVEVSLKKSGKKILLKPSEKLFVSNEYLNKGPEKIISARATVPDIAISQINTLPDKITAIETQWTQNKLAFKNQKLVDIVADLSRWYGVTIDINDENIREKTYSGIFENESINEVLDALKLAGGFDYKIENKKITIIP